MDAQVAARIVIHLQGSGRVDRGVDVAGFGDNVGMTVIQVEKQAVAFAVIESGGKQHRVIEGEILRLEKLDVAPGAEVVFDKVLMVADGDRIEIGAPYVAGGQVKAEVLAHDRAKKVTIIKFRRRQDYHKKQGHRQWFTAVKITGING